MLDGSLKMGDDGDKDAQVNKLQVSFYIRDTVSQVQFVTNCTHTIYREFCSITVFFTQLTNALLVAKVEKNLFGSKICFIFATNIANHKGGILIADVTKESMKGATKYFILAAALFWCCTQASAQRTMPGRCSVAIIGGWNGSSVSAEAFFSQYTLTGFWEAGVVGYDYILPINVGGKLRYDQLAVAGGYQFRLAATRDRAVNLYGGGGIYIGAELVDPLRQLPSYYTIPAKSESFLYGIYAKTEAEFFLGRRLAITVETAAHLNPSSKLHLFHFIAGLGLKLII